VIPRRNAAVGENTACTLSSGRQSAMRLMLHTTNLLLHSDPLFVAHVNGEHDRCAAVQRNSHTTERDHHVMKSCSRLTCFA